jgi:hypothetical protein
MIEQLQLAKHSSISESLINILPQPLVNVIQSFVPLISTLRNFLSRPSIVVESRSAKLHFAFYSSNIVIRHSEVLGAVSMTYEAFVAYLLQEIPWTQLINHGVRRTQLYYSTAEDEINLHTVVSNRISWAQLQLPKFS